MMWYLALIPLVIYVGLVLWFVRGWVLTEETGSAIEKPGFVTTLIIPFRNETESILRILNAIDKQVFDFEKLEVTLVDDHSTDNTLERINNFKGVNIKPIILKVDDNQTGKKAAINKAIAASKGEIIVCTDADCEIGENWLQTITGAFNNTSIQMVTGPVMFFERKGFWNQMMQLEFISLVGIGAASVKNGSPNMCSGANIAYRKQAYIKVNGFVGNEHIPSGDDEFLMHKINKHFNGAIKFIKSHEAIVYTEPPQSLNEFVSQRVRWGSKAGHYQNISSKLLPAFMFCFNALLFFTPLLYFAGMHWTVIAALWLGKLSVEIVFFAAVLPFFRSSKILDLVIPAQVFHVVYITMIGVMSVFASYSWKGRRGK